MIPDFDGWLLELTEGLPPVPKQYGSVLRVTDGERQAYVWKAETKEWEQVT